jgi:cyclophilin family peptidyl-prolyl cis-trans isomerase
MKSSKLTVTLLVFLGLLIATSLFSATEEAKEEAKENPVVVMKTSLGKIKIELYAAEAPISAENFLWYVNHEFYDGLIFHRVIPGFMIQGGGFNAEMKKKQGNAPIKNEATNGLSNERGTIAMARTTEINSATSQFFINLVDNKRLDHTGKTPRGYGYAVFGKVIEGMDVVDEIAKVKTHSSMGYDNVPKTPIEIEKAYVLEKKPEKKTEKKPEKKAAEER